MVAYLSRDIRNDDMDSALRRLCRLSCLPFLIVTIRGMKVTISRCSTLFSAYWVLLWMLKSVPPWSSGCGASYENTLYVMELKLDKTAGEAMEQINLKELS